MELPVTADTLKIANLAAACKSLQDAIAMPPRNDLERDGVIQRFEFTFELCWETLRKALIEAGRAAIEGSPKPILRAALQDGLITDIDAWFAFLEARNLVSHTYNAALAERVYIKAKEFAPFAVALLQRLSQSAP